DRLRELDIAYQLAARLFDDVEASSVAGNEQPLAENNGSRQFAFQRQPPGELSRFRVKGGELASLAVGGDHDSAGKQQGVGGRVKTDEATPQQRAISCVQSIKSPVDPHRYRRRGSGGCLSATIGKG